MHACMHAGASPSWKPVAPEENGEKVVQKENICMQACMLGHRSAGSRLHLREKCTTSNGKLTIYAFMHACMQAGLLRIPFRSGCVKQFKVTPRKLSACIYHACTSRVRAKYTILR